MQRPRDIYYTDKRDRVFRDQGMYIILIKETRYVETKGHILSVTTRKSTLQSK